MAGWSRVQWLKFSVLAGLLFVVAPILAPYVGGTAATAVVWASGIVLLIYTIETHEMRREMLRNNTMQVQPVLLTKLDDPPPGGGTGLVLWVWNVGKGAALHINFKDIDIDVPGPSDAASERLAVRFFTPDVLKADAGHVVETNFGVAAGSSFSKSTMDFDASLNPKSANQNHEIVIRYEDIDGRKYVSRMQMGKDGTRLLGVGPDG